MRTLLAIGSLLGAYVLAWLPFGKTRNRQLDYEITPRGFQVITIRDRNGEMLEIQESSLATEPCIWLGVAPERAHLTIDQVKAILPVLVYFTKHGTLPKN